MPEDLGGICPHNGIPCKEVIELGQKVEHIAATQKDTTVVVKDLGKTVNEILEFQGGTKVYVSEIKQQITTLETRLFTFMNDLVSNLTKKDESSDKSAATERDKNMDRWLGLFKYVLALTLGAIIAYIFKLQ